MKIATFEWVCEFEDFGHIILPELLTFLDSNKKGTTRALVVGCGTSSLSVSLADLGFDSVVSVDNDEGCISYMGTKHASDTRLKWIPYDIILRCLSLSIPADNEWLSELADESFDLIVDKATTDALMTQGPIHPMLADIHRMLKTEGIYVVCSAHKEELLLPLLGISELGFELTSHSISRVVPMATAATTGTIVICRKTSSAPINEVLLAESEKEVMDSYFCETKPFLTLEKETQIRVKFDGVDSKMLPLLEAYTAIFEESDMLNYDFSFFLEDLHSFPLATDGFMTADEAVRFLLENQ